MCGNKYNKTYFFTAWCPSFTLVDNLYGRKEIFGNGTFSILVPPQINTIKQQSFVCLNVISYDTWKQAPMTSTIFLKEEEVQFASNRFPANVAVGERHH